MTPLLSPEDISQTPSVLEIDMPAYDWNRQQRETVTAAGRYTTGSIQTFDGKGQAKDSRGDNTD